MLPGFAYFYSWLQILNLESAAAMATALGLKAQAKAYQADIAPALASYHSVFFNTTSGTYGHQQTANLMPLVVGAVPTVHVASVVAALVSSINDFPAPGAGPHVTVGGVGSRWLLQALTAVNRTDLALSLATQTSAPSWGHFATTVPGTFWEYWEPSDQVSSGLPRRVCACFCAWSGASDLPYLFACPLARLPACPLVRLNA